MVLTIQLPEQLYQFRLLNDITQADITDRSVERKNFEASFYGSCTNGGEVEADWLSLGETHIDIHKTDAKAMLDLHTGRYVLNPFDAIKHATILEGQAELDFIVGSKVRIKYSSIISNPVVGVFTGITNFIFSGSLIDKHLLNHNYIHDELIIRLSKIQYEFIKLPNYDPFVDLKSYDKYMNELKSKQVDVTCECVIVARYRGYEDIEHSLHKILYILSFATCNWLTTLYEKVYHNNDLIQITLFPHKTFSYIGGQYSINPTDDDAPLKKLVEEGHDQYSKLEEQLGLRFLIEDYIMSPRQDNLESEYLMLAVAFETLASYAQSLAQKNGDVIKNNLKQEKEKEIIKLSKKMISPLSDQLIEGIQNLGRFNDIRLKDKIKYIFDGLELSYTEKELSNFVKYRNIIIHSGISRDFKKLALEWHNLANLFDRLMLTIFQWRGKFYIDKSKDYTNVLLN